MSIFALFNSYFDPLTISVFVGKIVFFNIKSKMKCNILCKRNMFNEKVDERSIVFAHLCEDRGRKAVVLSLFH